VACDDFGLGCWTVPEYMVGHLVGIGARPTCCWSTVVVWGCLCWQEAQLALDCELVFLGCQASAVVDPVVCHGVDSLLVGHCPTLGVEGTPFHSVMGEGTSLEGQDDSSMLELAHELDTQANCQCWAKCITD
jgi:hypothetical protein